MPYLHSPSQRPAGSPSPACTTWHRSCSASTHGAEHWLFRTPWAWFRWAVPSMGSLSLTLPQQDSASGMLAINPPGDRNNGPGSGRRCQDWNQSPPARRQPATAVVSSLHLIVPSPYVLPANSPLSMAYHAALWMGNSLMPPAHPHRLAQLTHHDPLLARARAAWRSAEAGRQRTQQQQPAFARPAARGARSRALDGQLCRRPVPVVPAQARSL